MRKVSGKDEQKDESDGSNKEEADDESDRNNTVWA